MFLKTFSFDFRKKNNFIHYLLVDHQTVNDDVFVFNNCKNVFKKKKFILKKKKILNYSNLIDFFNHFLKFNFFFFIKINFFNKRAFLLFKELFWLSIINNLTRSFSIYFVFIFTLFIFYKNPNILFNFIQTFFRIFNFKRQRSLHHIIYYFSKKIKKTTLNKSGVFGFIIKFRGKYMRRAGDRRKTHLYKFFNYSTSNVYSKYNIAYRQLWNNSGATGLTINILFK